MDPILNALRNRRAVIQARIERAGASCTGQSGTSGIEKAQAQVPGADRVSGAAQPGRAGDIHPRHPPQIHYADGCAITGVRVQPCIVQGARMGRRSHVGYGGARQAPHGRRLLLPHTLAAQG